MPRHTLDSSSTRGVRLFGLLGNQLFQFALAKALSEDGEPALLDIGSGDPKLLLHAVREDAFRTPTYGESRAMLRAPAVRMQRRIQAFMDIQRNTRARSFLDSRTYVERDWGVFDPEILATEGPVLFKGYFQREEYFSDVLDAVAASFRPCSPLAFEILRESSGRAGKSAVLSVHLRAGADYARLGWTPHFDWFRRAAEAATESLGSVAFVVGSDVPLAAEAFAAAVRDLGPAEALRPAPMYDAMRAISLADHSITSPSTFSWWSTWLGDYRTGFDVTRLVLAPAVWVSPPNQPAPVRWTLVP